VVGWSGELGYGVRAPEAAQDVKDALSTPLEMIDEHGHDDHGHDDLGHDDGHGGH
jgi:hypothetical protein